MFPGDPAWQGEFKKRFAVLPDVVFDYLTETATEVVTRVRIDDDTKTVAEGQLWTEESLPAESILAGLVSCDRVYNGKGAITPQTLLDEYATRGAARCRSAARRRSAGGGSAASSPRKELHHAEKSTHGPGGVQARPGRPAARRSTARSTAAFAREFPTLVHQCGLAQAVAFAQAKKDHQLDYVNRPRRRADRRGSRRRRQPSTPWQTRRGRCRWPATSASAAMRSTPPSGSSATSRRCSRTKTACSPR